MIYDYRRMGRGNMSKKLSRRSLHGFHCCQSTVRALARISRRGKTREQLELCMPGNDILAVDFNDKRNTDESVGQVDQFRWTIVHENQGGYAPVVSVSFQ
jgi:hypothetical protein